MLYNRMDASSVDPTKMRLIKPCTHEINCIKRLFAQCHKRTCNLGGQLGIVSNLGGSVQIAVGLTESSNLSGTDAASFSKGRELRLRPKEGVLPEGSLLPRIRPNDREMRRPILPHSRCLPCEDDDQFSSAFLKAAFSDSTTHGAGPGHLQGRSLPQGCPSAGLAQDTPEGSMGSRRSWP